MYLNEFSQVDELHDDGLDPHDVVEEDLPLELLHGVQVPILLRVQGPDGSTVCAPDLWTRIHPCYGVQRPVLNKMPHRLFLSTIRALIHAGILRQQKKIHHCQQN
jgi:hypothetical protein